MRIIYKSNRNKENRNKINENKDDNKIRITTNQDKMKIK